MELYIFFDQDQVSHSYHPDGAFVVVARDTEHVMELIAEHNAEVQASYTSDYMKNKYDGYDAITPDWKKCHAYRLKKKDPCVPHVYVFPNAGCC